MYSASVVAAGAEVVSCALPRLNQIDNSPSVFQVYTRGIAMVCRSWADLGAAAAWLLLAVPFGFG